MNTFIKQNFNSHMDSFDTADFDTFVELYVDSSAYNKKHRHLTPSKITELSIV